MQARRTVRGVVATASGSLILAGLAGVAPAAATDTPSAPPAGTLRASALVNWHLAPSLVALRSEINARWPGRNRSSDGAIGDTRHQASTNSHNPARTPRGPGVGTQGAVHALDITAAGVDVGQVLDAVIGDPRVWYVIHGGRIWSRTTGWTGQVHGGDPHNTHIHVNLREDSHAAAVDAETDTGRWFGRGGGSGRGTSAQTRSAGTVRLTTTSTRTLQRALIARGYQIPSGPTGWYGPETTAAVRSFQRAQGWSGSGADGLAGSETLRRLGVRASTSGAAATVAATSTAASSSAKARASTGSTSGAYRPGTAAKEVYFLQQALIKRGYDIPAGPTGYYGTRTVDAVKQFQRDQGWPASQCDGIPGQTTLSLLGLR